MNTLKIRPRKQNNINSIHSIFNEIPIPSELISFYGKDFAVGYIISHQYEPVANKESDIVYFNESVKCATHFIAATEFKVDSDTDFFQKSRQLKRIHCDELFNSYSDNYDHIEYDSSDDESDDERFELPDVLYKPYNLMQGFMTKNIIRLIDLRSMNNNELTLNPHLYRFKITKIERSEGELNSSRSKTDKDMTSLLKRAYSNLYQLTDLRISNVQCYKYNNRALTKNIFDIVSSCTTTKDAIINNLSVEWYKFNDKTKFVGGLEKCATPLRISNAHGNASGPLINVQWSNIDRKYVNNNEHDDADIYFGSKLNSFQVPRIRIHSFPYKYSFIASDSHYNDEIESPAFSRDSHYKMKTGDSIDFAPSIMNHLESLRPAFSRNSHYKMKTGDSIDFAPSIINHLESLRTSFMRNSRHIMSDWQFSQFERYKRREYYSEIDPIIINQIVSYPPSFSQINDIHNPSMNYRRAIQTNVFKKNNFNKIKQSFLPVTNINDHNVTVTRDSKVIQTHLKDDSKVIDLSRTTVTQIKPFSNISDLGVDASIFIYLNQIKNKLVESSKKINNNNSTLIRMNSSTSTVKVHSLCEIPLKIYTCWHTKILPPQMSNNYNLLIANNPEVTFSLFDENECRDFIRNHFDDDVLNAYDTLIPSSYKSDLWRYCVLHKNGGIYIDIKYNCVNGFKLINLCEKEHFVMERKNIEWEPGSPGLYTALIVAKPCNEIIGKCIKQIVENVSNRTYGFNALYPTGPGLLGNVYFKNRTSEDATIDVDAFFSESQTQIIYKNSPILEIYPEYRTEQAIYQNAPHYSLLWESTNIYKLSIDHATKRDFSAKLDPSKKSVLVICHIGNFDAFEKMRHYVSFVQSVRNEYNIDLVFNLVNGLSSDNLARLNVYFPDANVVISDNYGFDIGSFYHILNIIKEKNIEYDYVLKIHTKTDDAKRFNVLNSIVSSRDKIIEILKAFDARPEIGCISSNRSFQTDDNIERMRNSNHLSTLLSEFGILNAKFNMPFPAGSMFWIRFDIIKRVYMQRDLMKICQSLNTEYTFDYNWFYFAYYNTVYNIKNPSALCNYYLKHRDVFSKNLFEAAKANKPEKKLRDGMIEHAHERLIAYAVNFCGKQTLVV